jgi:quercetin dioxygenase-like cupin family protein
MRSVSLPVVIALLLTAVLAADDPQAGGTRPQPALPASPKPVAIPAGRQVFYDTNAMPWVRGRKSVLGETVTFNLAELDPQRTKGRPASSGHWHDYEQILFGWKGVYDQSAGEITCRVGPMTACLEPPNVQHTVTGIGAEKVLTIEVLPLRRLDIFPPYPTIDYPKAAQPRPVPPGTNVFADFNKMPWVGEAGGGRFKALIGETSSLVLWHLPAGGFRGTAAPGHHHTVEQISFVLEGHAEARVGDQVRPIGPGTLIMIPSNVEHLPMQAVNGEDILLLDFQPIVRHDLLKRMGRS